MVIRKKEKVSVNGLEELYEKTISTYARRLDAEAMEMPQAATTKTKQIQER